MLAAGEWVGEAVDGWCRADYWPLDLLKRFHAYCLTHAIFRAVISRCPSSVLVPRDIISNYT